MTTIPDPPPVSTTALDWADRARRDGWRLSGGIWQHDDRPDAYDDGDWVYLSGGVWAAYQDVRKTDDPGAS